MHQFRRRFTYIAIVVAVAGLLAWNPFAPDPELPRSEQSWLSHFSVGGIALGLDISGGVELIYSLDTGAVDREIAEKQRLLEVLASEAAIDGELARIAEQIRSRQTPEMKESEAKIAELKRKLTDATDATQRERLSDELKRAETALQELTPEEIQSLRAEAEQLTQARKSKDELEKLREQLQRDIENAQAARKRDIAETADRIRDRIDATGMREVDVTVVGGNRIRVQLPLRLGLTKQEIAAKRARYLRWLDDLADPARRVALEARLEEATKQAKAQENKPEGELWAQEAKHLKLRLDVQEKDKDGVPGEPPLEQHRGLLLPDSAAVQEELGLIQKDLARLADRKDPEAEEARKMFERYRVVLERINLPARTPTDEELKAFAVRVGRPTLTPEDLPAVASELKAHPVPARQALGRELELARDAMRSPEERLANWVREEEKRLFDEQVAVLSNVIEQQGVLDFCIVQNQDHQDVLQRALELLKEGKAPPAGYRLAISEGQYKELKARVIERQKEIYFSNEQPDQKAEYKRNPDLRARLDLEFERRSRETLERYLLLSKEEVKRGELLLEAKPGLSGSEVLQYATTGFGDEGFQINMTMTAAGGVKTFSFTTRNVGKLMAIVLDGVVHSAPVIKTPFGEHGQISGSFTRSSAETLAQVLSAGSLAVQVKRESRNVVGATLGQDSIRKGLRSIIIGLILVVAVMGVYYLLSGLIADFALVLNLVLILGAMSFVSATMTLPGIAGVLLTLGMAVDANVLINERIREEKARGRPLRLAVQAGYERAWVTIFDSNITTLITALILYYAGSGPVKGFAITVFIGITASLFTAVVVTRVLIDFLLARSWVKDLHMLQLFPPTKVPFMRMRWLAYAASLVCVVGGLAAFTLHQDKYATDFTGGTSARVRFAQPQQPEKVRALTEKLARKVSDDLKTDIGVPDVQSFEQEPDGSSRVYSLVFRERFSSTAAAGAAVSGDDAQRFIEKLKAQTEAPLDEVEPVLDLSTVGPTVARELRAKAFGALALALAAIFIYILVRFEFNIGMGLGAIVSLGHDSAITVGALALADKFKLVGEAKIDLNIIAALLTIVGYSINDTIVVFDRIRENRRANRRAPLKEVIDVSVNQTLSRTTLTSFTTLVAVLALFLFGGGVVHGLAFALLVGFTIGTYSSIFVASAIYLDYENWRARRRERLLARAHGRPASATAS